MTSKRGRKSAASRLSIVPAIEPPAPEPPANLTPEAATIWREILSGVHHSQFRGSEFLLESYARCVAFERQFGRDVEELPAGPRRDEAGKSLRAFAHLAANLATKLRLSPRSRVDVTPGRFSRAIAATSWPPLPRACGANPPLVPA